MTDTRLRINAFVKLGTFLLDYCEYSKNPMDLVGIKNEWFLSLDQKITQAEHQNGWFTKENVLFSLENWGKSLTEEHLNNWLSNYKTEPKKTLTVAVIMAGNLPLVGFHDFLSVLLTGNNIVIKQSSNDVILLPFLCSYLFEIDSSLKGAIHFEKEKLPLFDAVIATGSNNTARYFEHYFSKKPNIIRKNRNSVAVLTGNETKEQLQLLGEDIFRYYGLGCRSVSKIFVPKGYNFDTLFGGLFTYNPIVNQHKYANNYDYNKAVYLMSEFKILDNGFLILKEDPSYSSPIASLFYEFYDDENTLKEQLYADKEQIQCIVANNFVSEEVAFGETQKPKLTDYADGIDTVEFLLRTSAE